MRSEVVAVSTGHRFKSGGTHPRGALGKWLSLALCLLGAGTAAAEDARRTLMSPRALRDDGEACVEGTLMRSSAVERYQRGREVCYNLPIQYKEGDIFNPSTGERDRVRLRSYGDSFVGPSIYLKPGQTLRMSLHNQLPEPTGCQNPASQGQVPDCKYFNETNLHTHGLWVSPSGNSDNVLLTLKPGMSFQYEYNVPEDHPAGTFWYHPHRHYSTSMQVASGMAGALIIKGERLPRLRSRSRSQAEEYIHGDIDTLLKPFEPTPSIPTPDKLPDYPEVVLLQQIPYACFTGDQQVQTNEKGEWTCGKGDTGTVESFSQQIGFDGKAGKSRWDISGRYTTLNGEVQPRLPLRSRRLYRFRLILAGVSESISLRIRKVAEGARSEWPGKMNVAEAEKHLAQTCTGEEVYQWEVAADGLTREKILGKSINHLQPGYRSDVLVAFPSPGRYCIFDDRSTATISTQPEPAKLLAVALVEDGGSLNGCKEVKAFITSELLRSADRLKVEPAVREKIKNDLKDDLGISLFVPHKSLTSSDLPSNAKVREVVFDFTNFTINGETYAHDKFNFTLPLGATEEWRLSSTGGNHPFHIHVNPFQIKRIKRNGVDVTEEANQDEKSQYFGMVDTWKDTLFVEKDTEITVYTRYKRYIGDFVLHCHILDHEDMGMMQNVRVELPDGKGGTVQAGHHH